MFPPRWLWLRRVFPYSKIVGVAGELGRSAA